MQLRVFCKSYIEEGDTTSYTVRVALAQKYPVKNARAFVDVQVTAEFFDQVDVGDEFKISFQPPAPEEPVEPTLEHQEAPSEVPPPPAS